MLYTLWTIQLGQWRKAQAQGIALLNTTAQSGIPAFAPDFALVRLYKAGQLSEQDYTQAYLERMRASYAAQPAVWAELEKDQRVAVACYCKAGAFCHRHLFVQYMSKHLQNRGHQVELAGELT